MIFIFQGKFPFQLNFRKIPHNLESQVKGFGTEIISQRMSIISYIDMKITASNFGAHHQCSLFHILKSMVDGIMNELIGCNGQRYCLFRVYNETPSLFFPYHIDRYKGQAVHG